MYSAYQSKNLKVTKPYDPDDKRLAGWKFRPAAWEAGKVYEMRDEPDRVIATVYNGLYFEVVNPGISGATEPTWNTKLNGITEESSGLKWKTKAYNMMPIDITVSSSVWTADGCTIANEAYTTTSTQCRIMTVTASKYFYLKNHVVFSNGSEGDFTLRYSVKQR